MSQPQVLRNDSVSATVLPDEGGRVQSLKDQATGVEFLFQSELARVAQTPSLHARFQDGACAGIEECLPSVGSCGEETVGGPVPDHGDFWQLPWTVQEASVGSSLSLSARGFSRPLFFRKNVRLLERSLHMSYSVENVGAQTESFLYACHPLLAVDAGDSIVLPEEVRSLTLNSSLNQRLGDAGDLVSWPVSVAESGPIDLSRVLSYEAGVAEMLYTPRLNQGRCGLYRASQQQGIVLLFDTKQLPYLGLWLCYGGWPEGGKEPLQYAVGLEPTFAPVGTLTDAQREGLACELTPHAVFSWSIDFQISPDGITLGAFRSFCRSVSKITLPA